MARIIDNVIALRIIYLLVQPFEQTDAFKLGLIDASGKKLKKAETREEKNSTSMLHRLVWNLKRMMPIQRRQRRTGRMSILRHTTLIS